MSRLIQTDIGKINGNWSIVPLQNLAETPQYGFTASALDKGDAKFLRITDINGFSIDWNSVPYCQCDRKEYDKYKLSENDILFARIGATTGKTCIVKKPPEAVFASYLIRVRTKASIVDPEYLYFFFQSTAYWKQVNVQKNNNLKKGVNASILKSLMVPLPAEKVEQRRIAAILSTVQRAIEQQERLIALTTELKKALMHKLFTEGTRGEPQKKTEIGLMPESWQVAKLGDFAKIERGKFSHRPRNDSRFYGGNIPFVQTGDVSNCDGHIRIYSQTLNKKGVAISKVFPKGTILITIAANIGYTGILEFDSACPDSLIGITPNEVLSVEFLNQYLTTQQPLMDRIAPQGTQKNINIQFLKPWPIIRPPIEEQMEIEKTLGIFDKKLFGLRNRKETLTELFQTLLHQLMTAQIRVDDIDLSELGVDAEVLP